MEYIESQIKVCKICGVAKRRYLANKYPNGRDKRWMSEEGILWSGLVCGNCQRLRMKEHMRKKRANETS